MCENIHAFLCGKSQVIRSQIFIDCMACKGAQGCCQDGGGWWTKIQTDLGLMLAELDQGMQLALS